MYELEPKVYYTKWFIVCSDEEKEFLEEIKLEVGLNLQEQFGGEVSQIY